MKTIYIDCSAGVSGQALLGALVDTGINSDYLLEEVSRWVKGDYKMSFQKTPVHNVVATRAVLDVNASGQAVPVVEFLGRILNGNADGGRVGDGIKKVLLKYATASSKLLNVPLEEVRMDSRGLLRAVVISAGYFAALDQTGTQKIFASPIPVRENKCGPLEEESDPLALELTRGLMARVGGNNSSTALGVALLSASANGYGSLPEILIHTVGYGAIEGGGESEVVRVVSGEGRDEKGFPFKEETVLVVEANIDNMSPEIFPYLIERLFAARVLDAFLTPIYMKKGRPAILLTVLCREEVLYEITEIIFKETTTLGVRIRQERRETLRRKFFKVSTPYGNITVKAGYLGPGGEPVQVAPEFEECKAAALEHGVPLKDVYAAAQQAALAQIPLVRTQLS